MFGKKQKALRRTTAIGAMIAGMAAIASPAMAQDQPAPTEAAAEEEEIIITGSRIQRPALNSGVPITTVSSDELLSSGDLSLGDALNDLPALRGTFSQSNSTRFIGTAGLNILDLRGLGDERTLTLINGRRHITALPGSYQVDTNTIASELLERVDVVTGGSSAVYGSDAVAGVVNFVTRTDFEGLRLTGQAGTSARGDRSQGFVALTAGQNFAEDRGNIAVAVEYSRAEAYKFVDRNDLTGARTGRHQFNLDEPTAGEPPEGDGIPDNQFYTDIRNNNISDGGLLTAVGCTTANFADTALCSLGSTGLAALPATYVFLPDGSLVLNPIDRDMRFVGSGNARGGLGSTLSNYGDLAPGLDRASINILAHYEINESFVPFIEAKFARLDVETELPSGPSFFQGSIPSFFGGGQDLRCDNPFITEQAYATLQNIGRCSPAIAYGDPNPTPFTISRNNVDWGIRSEDNQRDTYRVVTGLRGDFNDDWSYEVAINYGHFKGTTTSINNLQIFNFDGVNFTEGPFLNAINAVRNGSGEIVCGINADADPTNDDPNCFPLNPFGEGRSDPRAIDYVMVDSFFEQEATQTDITAFVTGDLSQLFELPGGPISFAIGGEYRKEEAHVSVDDLTASGSTFLTALQPVDYPDIEVSEAFGEIAFPILRDLPGADLLEFTIAGRRSEYSGNVGTADAYNFIGVYRPIEDITLRAAYGRSVRAPTQSNLFDPLGQNFAFISDPCDVLFINAGSTTRPGNCAADGVPVGFVNTPARSATLSFAQGGNELLVPEISDSYTYGLVLRPQWAPGLAVTVDYYEITVNDLIATLGAQQIINLCYDASSLDNQFCALVFRDPATSFFNDPAVISGPVNFARQETSGVDVSVYYTHEFDSGDELSARLIWSYTEEKNNFTDPTDPTNANRQLSELGDPQYEWNASLSYRSGPTTLRAELRYIGEQTIGLYEAQNSFGGNPPQNADQFPVVWYDPVTYLDLRVDMDFTDHVTGYYGMDNVTDEKPQFGQLGTGAGSAIFDNVGRFLYAGVRVDF